MVRAWIASQGLHILNSQALHTKPAGLSTLLRAPRDATRSSHIGFRTTELSLSLFPTDRRSNSCPPNDSPRASSRRPHDYSELSFPPSRGLRDQTGARGVCMGCVRCFGRCGGPLRDPSRQTYEERPVVDGGACDGQGGRTSDIP